jgi:arylsulfatase A-like enzyme
MNEKALDFVRRQKDGPFFLYMAWTIPHFEPHVPEDSMAPYRGKVPAGKKYSQANGRLKEQPELGPAYAGMVSRLDSYVGRLMALLKELNLERDTLVFFTSDNGGIMGDFEGDFFKNTAGLRGQKTTLYEGGIRVPTIARWPGRIRPGSTSSYAWSFEDFLPTAAEVAGAPAPKGIDGVSIVPVLTGRSQRPKEYLYWEHPRYNNETKSFRQEIPMQALRRGDWKIIRPKPDGPAELYRLSDDPAETRNLAASHPDVFADMERRLKAARTPPRAQRESPHPWWDARS